MQVRILLPSQLGLEVRKAMIIKQVSSCQTAIDRAPGGESCPAIFRTKKESMTRKKKIELAVDFYRYACKDCPERSIMFSRALNGDLLKHLKYKPTKNIQR